LETRLQNQGIGVGTTAYNNAMNALLKTQNDSYNNAAYHSVLAGQNAYNQSLSNAISAGNFANSAQGNYLSQILAQLQNSYSGYDNAMNIYNIQNASDARISNAKQANSAAQTKAGQDFVSGALSSAAMLFSDVRLKENLREVGKLMTRKPHRMRDLIHFDKTQAALAFANKLQVNRRLEASQLGKLPPRKRACPFTFFVKVLHVQAIVLIFCYRFHK
jgi:hypothetical protein